MVYGQVTPTSEIASIKDKVERTERDFHERGSPNYKSEAQPPLELPNGRKAEFYYYSGDQWGNFEAAAYFLEADTINFLVFNSRTKENFDKYVADFRQVAASYQNLYTSPKSLTKELLEGLENDAASLLAKARRRGIRSQSASSHGTTMANAMRDCTAYFDESEKLEAFTYFVRIKSDGSVIDSFLSRTNALSTCFQGAMSNVKYPAHALDNCVLKIEMEVTQSMREEAASQRGPREGAFVLKGGLEPKCGHPAGASGFGGC